MLLSNRDYGDNELFKLKERTETFTIDCIKCATTGTIIAILGIVIFNLLRIVGFNELIGINSVVVIFVAIYGGLVFLTRGKGLKNKEKEKLSKEEKIVKEQPKEESIVIKEEIKKVDKKEPVKKEKNVKPKKVKESKQKKMEEMKDNIL